MYKNVFKHNDKIYCVSTKGTDVIDFKPTMFVSSSKDKSIEFKTLLTEEPVYPINPGSMRETDKFVEEYKNVGGFSIHGCTNYVNQFIRSEYPEKIDFDIDDIRVLGIDIETSISNGFPDYKNPTEEILLVTLIDLKTRTKHSFGCNNYTSNLTNYRHCDNEKALLLSVLDFWKSDYPDIITGWNSCYFDIPYLYNRMVKVLGKDNANKLSPFGVVKPAPPKAPSGKAFIKEGEDRNITVRIYGISNLDYMDLIKKYGQENYESYRLDFIANAILGHAKLEHDEFDGFKNFYLGIPIPDKDGNEIQQLAYQQSLLPEGSAEYNRLGSVIKQLSWNKFTDYNVIDAELVLQLEDEKNMISLQVGVAYAGKVNYEDAYSPVGVWESISFNYLADRNIALPLHKRSSKKEQYRGAFVKEPIIGKHKYVASFDLASLYPHLIQQYNISPEMLTDTFLDLDTDYFLAKKPLPDNGLAISGSGWCFKKEKQGFLSELMESYYNRRKSVRNEQLKLESELELIKAELETSSSNETLNRKKLLLSKISSLDTEQMAIKTLINSLYGAYGESNFLFFDIRLAEAITMSGKLAILWVSNAISKRLNQILKTETVDYAIYNDTDSSYIALDKIVENSPVNGKSTEEIINFMDAFCKNIIQPTIESCYDELAEYTNAYANKMSMKREALADVGVWCCHPDVTIIVDDAPITIKELYDSSVNGIVDKECLSFNPKNKCFEIDIIEEVLRRPFSGDMYEFYLESGEILRVTGDHIIFIEREGKLLEVRAKDLIETDELISIE
jgi:DNA polymerase elongation subunit (family B)